MRKKITVMTAGIAAAMMMTACSGQPGQTAGAAEPETTKESSTSPETK